MAKTAVTGVRIEPEYLDRMDKLARVIADASPLGAPPLDRSAMVRALALRSLKELEAQYAIATPAEPAPATTPALAPVPEPSKAKHKTPDDAAVRAALDAALERGEKQKDIAERAGIDPTALSNFKRDVRPLPVEKRDVLAKTLGL